MQSLVGLSVRLFKGITLPHLACILQRKYFQLKVLDCLIVYFVVVEFAQAIGGIFGESSYKAYIYVDRILFQGFYVG
jgi:hypothetical protein